MDEHYWWTPPRWSPCVKSWEHSEQTALEEGYKGELAEEPTEINRNLDVYVERIVESMREGGQRDEKKVIIHVGVNWMPRKGNHRPFKKSYGGLNPCVRLNPLTIAQFHIIDTSIYLNDLMPFFNTAPVPSCHLHKHLPYRIIDRLLWPADSLE
jgi:hypothetical protein